MSNPIKVSFGIKYEGNQSSGKHKFANRLANSITQHFGNRIEIVNRIFPSQAHLTFDGKCKQGCKNIYRIDGVWINKSDTNLSGKNAFITSGLVTADAVIYQSEFCELAVNKYLKINPKQTTVIYNGADPAEFSSKLRYKPDRPSFITMCKWRPHKRFNNIAEGFIRSKASQSCDLHVFGEVEKKISHPNIIYHGWDIGLSKMLHWCIASVHISYLDWCPNAVVESLIAGVPVIYANSGGTPYIVKEDGFKIKDRSWDYSIIDLYGNHPVDIDELARAYDAARDRYLTSPMKIDRKDLHIDNVAARYVEFIEQVVKG